MKEIYLMNCFISKVYSWLRNKLFFDCCDRHQFDQTSTLGVEVWSKFRPNFDTLSVETSTKLRPNFDTPSVEVWSKFARYINEIHNEFVEMSTTLRYQTSTKLRHHIVQNILLYFPFLNKEINNMFNNPSNKYHILFKQNMCLGNLFNRLLIQTMSY